MYINTQSGDLLQYFRSLHPQFIQTTTTSKCDLCPGEQYVVLALERFSVYQNHIYKKCSLLHMKFP